MARGSRVKLQETIFLLIGLAASKRIRESEKERLKKTLERSLSQVHCQQKECPGLGDLVYFVSNRMADDLGEALKMVAKIRESWSKAKSSQLVIAIHKGGIPEGGMPGGFVIDSLQAIWRFAQEQANKDNESKCILSRDVYDFMQGLNKEWGYEIVNLGSRELEDIIVLTLYEIREPGKSAIMKLVERQIDLPLESRPDAQNIIGRSAELKMLHQWLSHKGPILIEGITGIGKTSLAAKFAQEVEERYSIFWLTITEETSSDIILAHLNHLLISNKDYSFELYQIDGQMELEKKLNYLVEALEKRVYLLFFDNQTYNIRDEKLKFILLSLSSKLKRSKLVLITTRSPDFFAQQKNIIKLDELNREEARELLKASGLEEDEETTLIEIQERLGCSPFSLNLLVNLMRRYWYDPFELLERTPRFKEGATNLLMTRFFNEASQAEKDILILMSALRKPVGVDFIALSSIYPPSEFEDKFKLMADFFGLIKDKDNNYSLHPLLKDFCYRLLPDTKFIHRKAAEVYIKMLRQRVTVEMIVEAHYHYLKAKEIETGCDHLNTFIDKLIEMGLIEPLENEINKYSSGNILLEKWVWICQAKGRIAQVKGDFERAQDCYRQMLEAASKIRHNQGKIKSFWLLAQLFIEQKHQEKAIEYYRKCGEIAQRIDDQDMLSRIEQAIKEAEQPQTKGSTDKTGGKERVRRS